MKQHILTVHEPKLPVFLAHPLQQEMSLGGGKEEGRESLTDSLILHNHSFGHFSDTSAMCASYCYQPARALQRLQFHQPQTKTVVVH